MDFIRCQRADGSVYGTAGKCRKGKEIPDHILDNLMLMNRGFVRKDELGEQLPKGSKMIGEGLFGRVYDLGGNSGVVIKVGGVREKELRIMEKLKGIKGIPRVLAENIEMGGNLLAMGKMKGETLREIEKKENGGVLMKAMGKGLSIVKQMHEKGVGHKDLHLGNFMYDKKSGNASVIDFGFGTTERTIRMYDAVRLNGMIKKKVKENGLKVRDKNVKRFLANMKSVENGPYRNDLQSFDGPSKERENDILKEIWKGIE